jgi:hypothetical protein
MHPPYVGFAYPIARREYLESNKSDSFIYRFLEMIYGFCISSAVQHLDCATNTSDNTSRRLVLPSFPLFGGERGFTVASSSHTGVCPLIFRWVCLIDNAVDTTQHRHRTVVPCWGNLPSFVHFTPAIRWLRHAMTYTIPPPTSLQPDGS